MEQDMLFISQLKRAIKVKDLAADVDQVIWWANKEHYDDPFPALAQLVIEAAKDGEKRGADELMYGPLPMSHPTF